MLSKKAKYAIKALIYLAKQSKDLHISIHDIADKELIPSKFLEAIMLELKKGGVVSSKKGKEGGYRLLKSSEEISLADIIRIIDGPLALLPCATQKYYQKCEECLDENHCAIRKAFMELRNLTVEVLKRYSLFILIEQEKN